MEFPARIYRSLAVPTPAAALLLLHAAATLLLRAAAAPDCASVTTVCCRNSSNCSYGGGSDPEHQYTVEGKNVVIDHSDGLYMNVHCNGSAVLDSTALPVAAARMRVRAVTFTSCPPPARSLAAVLDALNVTLLSSESPDGLIGRLLLLQLPATPPLADRHFVGLEHVLVLRLYAAAGEQVSPESGFLRPLTNLRVLMMQKVTLPAGELDNLPDKLSSLSLQYTGVARLPVALLASTHLRSLTIQSEGALEGFTMPPNLTQLDLRSPAVNLTLDSVATLPSLTLTNWVKEETHPLLRCDNLTSLQLILPAVKKLPKHWLSKCSRLRNLDIQYAKNLTSLPPQLLKNVTTLTDLSFKNCALETLPVDLLESAYELRKLYLIGNPLLTLPSSLFSSSRHLRELNLSSNNLDGGVWSALEMLPDLIELHLANNPRIVDPDCGNYRKSPIRHSINLQQLILSKTSVDRICLDWRVDMPNLTMLDLRNTTVKELWYEDLQFESAAMVMLEGAPVVAVAMSPEQYLAAESRRVPSGAHVQLDSELVCDCNMYWTRRALDLPQRPLGLVSGLKCAHNGRLAELRPDELTCPGASKCARAALPAECASAWRPHGDPNSAALVVRVECASRGLREVPRPRTHHAGACLYELLLRDNFIEELDAEDLQPDILKLDLRNNNLKKMDGETVTQLYDFKGVLQLANNSLDCSCSSARMVGALQQRLNATDLRHIGCDGAGSLLEAAPSACMSPASWLACALAVLLALAIGALAYLSSRERRFFLKAVLHRWGCLWYAAEPEEDRDRLYDAFVTFSQKDEPVVVELMARLEPPYRLCVHHRDWVPGRYISEQIAESVASSRRTIALVSRHYQESGWALAEFKLAHAAAMREARPRLVVVLLEEPSALQLDDQLRNYLKTNTYVRWGDSWFWDKLMAALPRPRPVDVTARLSAVVTDGSAAAPASAVSSVPAPETPSEVPPPATRTELAMNHLRPNTDLLSDRIPESHESFTAAQAEMPAAARLSVPLREEMPAVLNDSMPLREEMPKAPNVSLPPQEAPIVLVPPREAAIVSVPPREAPTVSVPPRVPPTVSVPPREAPTVSVPPREAPTVSVPPREVPTVSMSPREALNVSVPSREEPPLAGSRTRDTRRGDHNNKRVCVSPALPPTPQRPLALAT